MPSLMVCCAVFSLLRSQARASGTSSPTCSLPRSEEHTSELQSPCNLVCRLLLEKKKNHHPRLLTRPLSHQSLLVQHSPAHSVPSALSQGRRSRCPKVTLHHGRSAQRHPSDHPVY